MDWLQGNSGVAIIATEKWSRKVVKPRVDKAQRLTFGHVSTSTLQQAAKSV